MLVYTALLNCAYQGGAPSGNGARACSRSRVASSEAWASLPDLASRSRLDRRAGRGKPSITSPGPFSPAHVAWLSVLVNHLMNLAAASGFLAAFGMPMPSGLAMFAPGPETPGVGT